MSGTKKSRSSVCAKVSPTFQSSDCVSDPYAMESSSSNDNTKADGRIAPLMTSVNLTPPGKTIEVVNAKEKSALDFANELISSVKPQEIESDNPNIYMTPKSPSRKISASSVTVNQSLQTPQGRTQNAPSLVNPHMVSIIVPDNGKKSDVGEPSLNLAVRSDITPPHNSILSRSLLMGTFNSSVTTAENSSRHVGLNTTFSSREKEKSVAFTPISALKKRPRVEELVQSEKHVVKHSPEISTISSGTYLKKSNLSSNFSNHFDLIPTLLEDWPGRETALVVLIPYLLSPSNPPLPPLLLYGRVGSGMTSFVNSIASSYVGPESFDPIRLSPSNSSLSAKNIHSQYPTIGRSISIVSCRQLVSLPSLIMLEQILEDHVSCILNTLRHNLHRHAVASGLLPPPPASSGPGILTVARLLMHRLCHCDRDGIGASLGDQSRGRLAAAALVRWSGRNAAVLRSAFLEAMFQYYMSSGGGSSGATGSMGDSFNFDKETVSGRNRREEDTAHAIPSVGGHMRMLSAKGLSQFIAAHSVTDFSSFANVLAVLSEVNLGDVEAAWTDDNLPLNLGESSRMPEDDFLAFARRMTFGLSIVFDNAEVLAATESRNTPVGIVLISSAPAAVLLPLRTLEGIVYPVECQFPSPPYDSFERLLIRLLPDSGALTTFLRAYAPSFVRNRLYAISSGTYPGETFPCPPTSFVLRALGKEELLVRLSSAFVKRLLAAVGRLLSHDFSSILSIARRLYPLFILNCCRDSSLDSKITSMNLGSNLIDTAVDIKSHSVIPSVSTANSVIKVDDDEWISASISAFSQVFHALHRALLQHDTQVGSLVAVIESSFHSLTSLASADSENEKVKLQGLSDKVALAIQSSGVTSPDEFSTSNARPGVNSTSAASITPITVDPKHISSSTLSMNNLPTSIKYLLVAAFLASHTPSEYDLRLFSRRGSGKKRRQNARTSGVQGSSNNSSTNSGNSNNGSCSESRLNPFSGPPMHFVLERLLAITYALIAAVEGPAAMRTMPHSALLQGLNVLVRLRLVGRIDQDDSQVGFAKGDIRFRCNAEYVFVNTIAKEIKVDLSLYSVSR